MEDILLSDKDRSILERAAAENSYKMEKKETSLEQLNLVPAIENLKKAWMERVGSVTNDAKQQKTGEPLTFSEKIESRTKREPIIFKNKPIDYSQIDGKKYSKAILKKEIKTYETTKKKMKAVRIPVELLSDMTETKAAMLTFCYQYTKGFASKIATSAITQTFNISDSRASSILSSLSKKGYLSYTTANGYKEIEYTNKTIELFTGLGSKNRYISIEMSVLSSKERRKIKYLIASYISSYESSHRKKGMKVDLYIDAISKIMNICKRTVYKYLAELGFLKVKLLRSIIDKSGMGYAQVGFRRFFPPFIRRNKGFVLSYSIE